MSKRRGKKNRKKEVVKPDSEEVYNELVKFGSEVSRIARPIVSENVGFDVGKPTSIVPLFNFRCKKCRNDVIFHLSYKDLTVIICPKCSTSEIFNPYETGLN